MEKNLTLGAFQEMSQDEMFAIDGGIPWGKIATWIANYIGGKELDKFLADPVGYLKNVTYSPAYSLLKPLLK